MKTVVKTILAAERLGVSFQPAKNKRKFLFLLLAPAQQESSLTVSY
jgi:hypothetical protein